jgi:hypothetical protein
MNPPHLRHLALRFRQTSPLVWIILLAILPRLAAALAMGNSVQPLPGAWDQISYQALAERVATGHGFRFAESHWPVTAAGAPTAHWSFLYTGFLAAIYALVGSQPLVARLLQALLVGILLPWGSWRLAERTVGRAAAPWAALASAGYLYFIYYSATLMTEMFTICAILWMLGLACDLAEQPRPRTWLAFGGLIGITALMRQVALLPVPLLCLWIFWRHRKLRTLGGIALAALVSLALILPVTLRNQRAFGRFVLINTNAGYAFFWANHPVHGTDFQSILSDEGPGYVELIPPELRQLDEAALNDALMARGWDFVRADPVRYLRLSASRIADYFQFWPSARSSRLSNFVRLLSFGLMLPFMLLGLLWSRRRWRALMPIYLFAGFYTVIHLLSWALIRYRLPVDAVLLVPAGLALERLLGPTWGRFRTRVTDRRQPPGPGSQAGEPA